MFCPAIRNLPTVTCQGAVPSEASQQLISVHITVVLMYSLLRS